MSLRFAVLGLLAGLSLSLSLAAAAQETSPAPETPAIDTASDTTTAESVAPAASTAGEETPGTNGEGEAQAAQSADGSSEAGAGDNGAESAANDPAAAAMDIEADKTKAFDPNKAKPSEIAAYNATAEPDDRIVCKRDRESAGVGARFSQKVCRTARQWRELSKR